MKKISISIACYNEVGNIESMYNAITEQMLKIPQYDYEIIFADNDSKDGSEAVFRKLALMDSRVKVIFNRRNFGADRSSINCFLQTTGDAVICLAADFQDPPELIPRFVEEWEKGAKVVWGQKIDSQESWFMWKIRGLYYAIVRSFSELTLYDHVTGYGLYDKCIRDLVNEFAGRAPLIRNLIPEFGFEPVCIPYHQKARRSGKSSYNFYRYFDTAISSLVNTSRAPLHMATLIGFNMAVLSFFLGVAYLIAKLLYWDHFPMGTAPILIGMFFLGATQLLFIGLLGEYIGQILSDLSKQPRVIEKERLNFDDEE